MYYNEWENIIRDRLRNYNIWTARVNTLEAQIREIAGQLRLEAAPKTTKFGYDSFGGGWDKPLRKIGFVHTGYAPCKK